ncbi:MAG: pyruvate dehydrogenase (acetyl-transferring), homodimeric type [Gammaproteobacteria bacterium]|nr:pyruvate dehydrogenase (acetyl-transferring), homodimeric type [Gammaproteobacteria bacterium]
MSSLTHSQAVIAQDVDPLETNEWLDALTSVIEREGNQRAHFLIETLIDKARRSGVHIPYQSHTAYLNTIPPHLEERSPGDNALERRIRALIRWNAMAMVVRANRISTELGGHIASFASAATLYDIGFNHFWRANTPEQMGDLVFIQGHSAPGIYARAYLERRLNKEDLRLFRQEVSGKGISSYPHPWLMPDFWQFPTVSMGLGPIMAIHQARYMKYLHNRGLIDAGVRKVWAFLGDGEMDEPESRGALALAGRENLDNLIFVINCNLQRLDGPVRGNGKIIQELEGDFRGAGWNVIKVIWGGYWDPLLMRDDKGLLKQRMEEAVDGEYQAFKAKDGAYVREKFFGKYPELREMVSNMTDEDIWRLNRGGHDPHKVYAAYAAAAKHTGQPTVILAKTVKGYGMGEAGEGQNTTHQQKKMGEDALLAFRDRFNIPLTDEEVAEAPFYRPEPDSPETEYLMERRHALGGFIPSRINLSKPSFDIPDLSIFANQLEGTGDREISTTMAFVRILSSLIRDKSLKKYIVPIIPDESRTFGMEGMFRQLGIYSPKGQLYEPEDADQLMFYREDKDGQVLQEGINEAGAMSSWIAAGTAYSNHDICTIPFFILYSMFGFQRIGDLCWAAGDSRARGFILGGTAGRTTLAGEGLQHQDGHSLILSGTVPNCVSYDPTYGYELAVIIHDGLRRMYDHQESIYYYITVMNENYVHPEMPKNAEEGILRGMYLLKSINSDTGRTKVQLFGGGTILREIEAAAEILKDDYQIDSDIWSVTSFNELARDGQSVARHNRLHPEEEPRQSYVEMCLNNTEGPVIAATDYIKLYAEQIRAFVPNRYYVLGTDGYGRSDTREQLRKFFEVDRYNIVVATLDSLVEQELISPSEVVDAIARYDIDPEKPNPVSV